MKKQDIGITEQAMRSIRKIIAGRDSKFCFNRYEDGNKTVLSKTGLYIHIPFCKSLCPYCPYNRIPYNEELMHKYIDALMKEISYYGMYYSNANIESVYFGGGTPTLVGDRMKEIVQVLRENFSITNQLSIETNPSDINTENINILEECRFSSISLGIQTFNENMLKLIGRKYSPDVARNAIQLINKGNFRHINVDLLFALPTQSRKDIMNDIDIILQYKPSQITFYPLFTFPYSEINKYKNIKSVQSPSILKRRSMFYAIYDKMTDSGYEQCSVWSFRKKTANQRYSSVTRERYLGMGASAGSYYETHFTLNTFDVEYYIELIESKGHSAVLDMPFTRQMSELYDFYWRIYDTRIPIKRNLEYSSFNVKTHSIIKHLIRIMMNMGWIKESGNAYMMTRSGSMWTHFIQNMFSLRYIDRIWGQGKQQKTPKRICF